MAAGTTLTQAGLIGHWTFDEASSGTGTGIALDSSGGGNDGTIHGSAKYAPGRIGTGALRFDGIDDFVLVGLVPALDLTGGDYLIAFWLNNTGPGGTERVVDMNDGNSFGGGYTVSLTSNHVFASHNNGNNNNQIYPPLPTTGWHHVAAVYDESAATRTMYYDGAVIGTTAIVGGNLTSEGDDPLQFGAIPFHGQYLSGSLDDVQIHNSALSAAQVGSLTAVPEASKALVVLLGMTGLLGVRRRKR